MAAGASVALFVACDKGNMTVDPGRQGPAPRVIASVPSSTDAAATLPANGVIRLRFDRFLRPDTVVRQSIRLTGGTLDPDGGASLAGDAFLEPTYDVLERVVTFAPSGKHTVGALYTVTLWSPKDPLRAQDGFGLRALDGAPLEASIAFHFKVTAEDPTLAPQPPSASPECVRCQVFSTPQAKPGCKDPLPSNCFVDRKILPPAQEVLMGSCVGGSCHSATQSAGAQVGLDLSSADGILHTAIARPAHETLNGPDSVSAPEHPPIYGVNMPLIDPGNPANSYILYKMIFTDDDGLGLGWADTRDVEPGLGDPTPSVEENARLRAFVHGTHMPIGSFSLSDAKAIQAWIAGGAKLSCADPEGAKTAAAKQCPKTP